ncbi:MAG TPA: orotate phosphoribosyltransferase [Lentisphaeria bacterium]|jgi:orotate phosphoribosyltransferase|nr:orotate phosphoribosyltransferase [Lentisphaeria bacterium]
MTNYKQNFISFMLDSGGLRFGDFTTKSGRKTPYFINTGQYATGPQIAKLGSFYAAALADRLGREYDTLFGPAYKGVPLVVTASMALAAEHDHTVNFTFNRKEAKDHGEKGVFVGHPFGDGERVVIVEDVVTAGTSVRETVPLLRSAADVTLAGLIVSVDREEKGTGERNALDELATTYDMPAFAIVTLSEIVAHVTEHGLVSAEILRAIADYRARWGA